LAFAACLLLWLLPPWWSWVAGISITLTLFAAIAMARCLYTIHRANRFYNRIDGVLLNHRVMNSLTILCLGYAQIALWRNWPAAFIAVLVAVLLNFFHYYGYRASAERITRRASGSKAEQQ
jgi:hypothetical protein